VEASLLEAVGFTGGIEPPEELSLARVTAC
jgi:hypothetical protein